MWVKGHKAKLLEIWNTLKTGGEPIVSIAELAGTE
jgi:hypothetical protein